MAPGVAAVAGAAGVAEAAAIAPDGLVPYVPRLLVDWLIDSPEAVHRAVPGSAAFADISGFTALTERLARRGRVGAEEMGDLLNAVFDQLLPAAYDYGANLVKWGGDAVLLLFDGPRHAEYACRAAWAMQETMRRIGRLETSCGVVRLGMSIGVHSGEFDFVLTRGSYRELVVTGPAATTTAKLEKDADRGQVVISTDTARLVPADCFGPVEGAGLRLVRPPEVAARPNRAAKRHADLGQAFCGPMRDHLRSGAAEHEHRNVTVGFIEFSGTDELLRTRGPQALAEAVSYVVDAVQEAADDNDVAVLSTDLCEDGGKVIVVAGAPRATGDDETRVLSTVRRVVHPGGRLSLRAGVTCGPVFAGDYGPFYRKVYSITGDIVNLAARLMTTAAPGQVVALPSVVERSRTSFDVTPLQPFAVKGKADPVHAVLVGDPRRASAPAAAAALPLVGRDRELATLLDAAHRAADGHGGIVEIVAPPGLGKSRLTEELAERVSARVLWADGDIYGTATPYQPMQRLLRRTLGLPDDVEDEVLVAVLTDLVAGSAPDLLPWLPLIGIVAGVDLPSTPEVDTLDPGVRKARLDAVTSDLLGRLLTMPIVMVFNDLMFMDDATIDFLRQLAADVVDRPWLLVATRRPEADPLEAVPGLVSLVLEPLDEAAADELMAAVTDERALPSHRLRELVARAGGNPLFLRALVAGALAGEDLDELPDSVEAVIAAGIDRLGPSQRRCLRAAAVLGMTVDVELLEEVLRNTGALDDLAAWSQLGDYLAIGADGQWRFTHHLIRATAYAGLPYRRRTLLHAHAADALQRRVGDRAEHYADTLSMHSFHGERFANAWKYSKLAGDRARDRYAGPEAAECYRRALAAAPRVVELTGDEVADVCEALADVCSDLGEMAGVDAALRQARGFARDDPHRLARLRLKTARHRQHVGRHTEALRWLSQGRAALSGRDDVESRRLRAELAEVYALIRYDQGRSADAVRWARRAVEESRQCGDRRTEARALEVYSVFSAAAGGSWDDEQVQSSLAIYDQLGDLRGTARACNRFGIYAYFAGRWDKAVEYYAMAERAYHTIGRESAAAMNAANAAEVLIQQGHVDAVTPLLTAAMRVWLASDATSFLAFGTGLLGQAAMGRGEYGDAMGHYANARALCVTMGETDEVVTVDALAAQCHLLAGEAAEALALAEQTLGRAGPTASALPLLLRVRGAALAAAGRAEEASAVLRDALSLARSRDAHRDVAATLGALLDLGVASDEAEAAEWRLQRFSLRTALGLVAD